MTQNWIAYVSPFVAVVGLVLTIWWKVEGKIEKATSKADKAIADLAAFKLQAAETFVTKAGMQEQTSQIMRRSKALATALTG